MHAGRKILNLRCDRKISQQDLARACDITPSALSKIEAGINSPRANIIWRIARNLGVTVEYLLDENIPYPYPAYTFRQRLLAGEQDPKATRSREVTKEEELFLDAFRQLDPTMRETCFSLTESPVELLRLVHFLVHHWKVTNPGPDFRRQFEELITTGNAVPDAPPEPVRAAGKRASSAAGSSTGTSSTGRSTRSGKTASRSATGRSTATASKARSSKKRSNSRGKGKS